MAVYLPILTAVLAGLGFRRRRDRRGDRAGHGQRRAAGRAALRQVHRGVRLQPQLRGAAAEGPRARAARRRRRPAAAGLGRGRRLPRRHRPVRASSAEDAQELLTPLRDLFAAVFFVFFGLQHRPGQDPPGCRAGRCSSPSSASSRSCSPAAYAAHRAGIARAGQARAGIALIPRGEFNIVIAGLAVAAGVHPDLGPLAAAYVLILAAFGPLAARIMQPFITAIAKRA